MAKKSSGNAITISGEDDWRVENDLRTMMDCEAIENDPKRLAKVQALAKKKMMDMASIASEGPKD